MCQKCKTFSVINSIVNNIEAKVIPFLTLLKIIVRLHDESATPKCRFYWLYCWSHFTVTVF